MDFLPHKYVTAIIRNIIRMKHLHRNNFTDLGTIPCELPLTTSRLSYFSNPGTSPLLGLTIGGLLDYASRKYGNNEFLVVPFQGIRKTYKQLKEEVSIYKTLFAIFCSLRKIFFKRVNQANKTYLNHNQVDNLATGLLSLGMKRGDRLAIWSPNTYECYVTQLAAWKAGLILVG